MRLWHQELIDKLPRQQLIGQHRECCALRGNGWNQSHSTVDYVFDYAIDRLIAYHYLIMDEMKNRGYNPADIWYNMKYRGKNCDPLENIDKLSIIYHIEKNHNVYPSHHDQNYLQECISNLKNKGVTCKYF